MASSGIRHRPRRDGGWRRVPVVDDAICGRRAAVVATTTSLGHVVGSTERLRPERAFRIAEARPTIPSVRPECTDSLPPMLRATGVRKQYGARRVLNGVDLGIERGEIVALLGENGAGKSTLLSCLAGLARPDSGQVWLDDRRVIRAQTAEIGVVWQDLALCDNLDVVANVFLGVEKRRGRLLDDREMIAEACRMFERIGAGLDRADVESGRHVGDLSGGQRQMVAIARALLPEPDFLLLDEPTASLGVNESAALKRLLRRVRSARVGILLITHRIEDALSLADRVVVLRGGVIVADRPASTTTRDEAAALLSGLPPDSAARRHLHQLRDLVDRLGTLDATASLPLIMSALAAALDTVGVSLHLRDTAGDHGRMTLRGCYGQAPEFAHVVEQRCHPGALVDRIVTAAATRPDTVAVGDGVDAEVEELGVGSLWAIAVNGPDHGVLGVIAFYAETRGEPRPDQVELATLHTVLAAAAVERERLVNELQRRNQRLESLRGVLDSLTGPSTAHEGVAVALPPLRAGLGSDAVALFHLADGRECGERVDPASPLQPSELAAPNAPLGQVVLARLAGAAMQARDSRSTVLEDAIVAIPLESQDRRDEVLVAWWDGAHTVTDDQLALLGDSVRSLGLASERRAVEESRQEAQALRQSAALQREFLFRLSHELRTPLTAIRGYADSLASGDVAWGEEARRRFIERIRSESARVSRLVADLLDTSAIETGGLRLNLDWCDPALLIEEAADCVGALPDDVTVDLRPDLPAVWADHDRIEQVVVNLAENALRHGTRPVTISAAPSADGSRLVLEVRDHGTGFDESIAERAFEATVRDERSSGAGLGLAIVRGIVDAHGGDVIVGRDHDETVVVVTLPIEPEVIPA